jgi:hypothetical protein
MPPSRGTSGTVAGGSPIARRRVHVIVQLNAGTLYAVRV